MRAGPNASLRAIRSILSSIAKTPLHPQWFAFVREDRNLKATCAGLSGIVLDVGCAEAKARRLLVRDATYVGVDHYTTATELYNSRPDIYADAQALPLVDQSVDHVLLLDVLEHVMDPDRCLAEIGRTLRPGGTLTVQVPFMYPVHDAPLDFHRWTRYGMTEAAANHGFRIVKDEAIGHPLETAALNANIAMSKTILNWLRGWNPLAVLLAVLPFTVLLVNSIAWLLAALSRPDDMMPYAYRMVWVKP